MSNTIKRPPNEVKVTLLFQNKIQLFTKKEYFNLFSLLIAETILSSSFVLKKDLFRLPSKKKKHFWVEICKSTFIKDNQYSTSKLAVEYLRRYCSTVLNKLLIFSLNNNLELSLIVKVYLKQCKEEIELKNAKCVFRNILNQPNLVIDKKLSQNLLGGLWEKAMQSKMISRDTNKDSSIKEEDEGAKESNANQGKHYCRYNVISPYIHYASLNPIDSDSLSQRLNDNYELLRFKKIQLKNEVKHYNDQYDPLIKKKRKPFRMLHQPMVNRHACILNQSQSIPYLNAHRNKNIATPKSTLSIQKLLLNHNQSSCLLPYTDIIKTEKKNQKYSVPSSQSTGDLSRNRNSFTNTSLMMMSSEKNRTLGSRSCVKNIKFIQNLFTKRKERNYFTIRDLYY